MFRKTILAAATLAVALVAFQPAAQAHGFNIKFGHGHWGHGHGGWGHGGWGHGGWGHGHGGWSHGHGGHGGCKIVTRKKWHNRHGHFHFKNVKVCR